MPLGRIEERTRTANFSISTLTIRPSRSHFSGINILAWVANQRNNTLQASVSKVRENNLFALNIADLAFPMEKMVSFSKLPGIVAFCIVVLTRTLGSASPVPQGDSGGLAAIIEPALMGVANHLLTGIGSAVAGAAGGTPETTNQRVGHLHKRLQNAGVSAANLAPAVQDTMYVQP